MREILFRGERIDNGEWIYGDLINQEPKCKRQYIHPHFEQMGSIQNHPEEVIPETVGQFTGLTDKNGKQIFEGDIISVEFELDREPELGEPTKWYENYFVAFDEEHHCWGTKISNDVFGEWLYEYDDCCAAVVGNIYDNPELLGESHEHY